MTSWKRSLNVIFIVSVSPVDGLKEFNAVDFYKKMELYLASDEGKSAKKRIPVFRLWCNVEIAAAYNKKIPIVINTSCNPLPTRTAARLGDGNGPQCANRSPIVIHNSPLSPSFKMRTLSSK